MSQVLYHLRQRHATRKGSEKSAIGEVLQVLGVTRQTGQTVRKRPERDEQRIKVAIKYAAMRWRLTARRLVDNMTRMSTQQKSTNVRPRQIIGFSLSPELAREVKAEAASRGISLRTLFEELWEKYKKGPTAKAKS